jgi:hypothetical protein
VVEGADIVMKSDERKAFLNAGPFLANVRLADEPGVIRSEANLNPENDHVRKPLVENRGHGKMAIWNYRGVKNATALCRVGTHVLTVLFSSESLPPGFIVGRFVRPALRKSNIALSTVPLQPRRRQASGHVFAAVQK